MTARKRTTVAAALMLALAAPAASQTPSAEQLIKQLECRAGQDCALGAPEEPATAPPAPGAGRKRSFVPSAGGESQPAPGSAASIPMVKRSFRFEATTEQGRQEVEKRVESGKLPSTDLEIYFDFNSSAITPQAQQALQSLGTALADPRLANFRFVLVGHTDAKGGDAFNQRLSEQRAAAVKDYLVRTFPILPERIDTYGRGKSLLKSQTDPFAAVNRRVQVINQGGIAAR